MSDVKPGWKTTEFWIAVLFPLVSLGVAFGVIGQDQADAVQQSGSELINAIFAVVQVLLPVVSAWPAANYISSRAKVKAADGRL